MKIFKGNFKMVLMIMSLLCFYFIGVKSVYASTTSKIPVTYIKTESAAYPLYVDVNGDGEVSDGKETLRNQEKKYLLPVDESIAFEIKTDEGAEVKSIKLNGKNVEGNNIIVEGAEKEQRLSISFEKSTSTNGEKFPHTGDTTKIGISILMFILSVVGASYMYYSSRKQKNIKR